MTIYANPLRQAQNDTFHGAKLMLFLGRDLLVIRRDHSPGIPWPGYLDWPGGGREDTETAEACALRETREEVGLALAPGDLHWRHLRHGADGNSWFFAARLPVNRRAGIVFGGEGTGWALMPPARFLDRADAIPHFRDVLAVYLAEVPV